MRSSQLLSFVADFTQGLLQLPQESAWIFLFLKHFHIFPHTDPVPLPAYCTGTIRQNQGELWGEVCSALGAAACVWLRATWCWYKAAVLWSGQAGPGGLKLSHLGAVALPFSFLAWARLWSLVGSVMETWGGHWGDESRTIMQSFWEQLFLALLTLSHHAGQLSPCTAVCCLSLLLSHMIQRTS